jgi:diacylglycerol kinase (ATP)
VRCVFIYNPAAGRNRNRRRESLGAVVKTLSAQGHQVEISTTNGPESATSLAREAAATGAEIVFACGGDGTIHEVLQALASESGDPAVSMGIIPVGSANALARHLKISLDPLEAALQQINGADAVIPVGRLTYENQICYFAVMAGAGPAGTLAYEVLSEHKSGMGRLAYYLHAARLFATRRFRPFEIEYSVAASSSTHIRKAVSVMAVRIGNLGGLFSKLSSNLGARHATVYDPQLRLLILSPPAALSLPLWFVSGWLNLHRANPFLHLVDVASLSIKALSCRSEPGVSPHIQADGEWLGYAPMHISLIQNGLRIRTASMPLAPATDAPTLNDIA